jgi:plasmid stability protein
MEMTIPNLDETAYHALKARAALAGKTIGEMVSEAIHAYLAQAIYVPRQGSLRALSPEAYDEGSERLSEEIDTVAYGV